MRNLYILTAWNLVGQYKVDTLHFSNKKEALKQMALLREYLISNHSLDTSNIRNEGLSTDDKFSVWLDDTYKVELRTTYLLSKSSRYI